MSGQGEKKQFVVPKKEELIEQIKNLDDEIEHVSLNLIKCDFNAVEKDVEKAFPDFTFVKIKKYNPGSFEVIFQMKIDAINFIKNSYDKKILTRRFFIKLGRQHKDVAEDWACVGYVPRQFMNNGNRKNHHQNKDNDKNHKQKHEHDEQKKEEEKVQKNEAKTEAIIQVQPKEEQKKTIVQAPVEVKKEPEPERKHIPKTNYENKRDNRTRKGERQNKNNDGKQQKHQNNQKKKTDSKEDKTQTKQVPTNENKKKQYVDKKAEQKAIEKPVEKPVEKPIQKQAEKVVQKKVEEKQKPKVQEEPEDDGWNYVPVKKVNKNKKK